MLQAIRIPISIFHAPIPTTSESTLPPEEIIALKLSRGIGGAGLCATIWAVIIPAVLAIKARKKFPNQMFTVWGGNLIPAIVILFGITVILCWFGNVFNVLPKFG